MPDLSQHLMTALADRYRIERELGRGGMGTVYLAEDLKHHRRVAIKVLQPELAAALGRERFLREIEISASLNHPHILPVFDSGTTGELLYYVMPYVEGESLRDRLARETQLPLDDALKIAREVADALAFAHGHGVVHRDIKPGNILLQGGHAVVADFGLARAMASAGVDPLAPTAVGTLTAPGSALGTPVYMSPEQAAGARDVDGRSDLYSLGCVLYEMLAGQPPFTGPTVESLVHQHLSVTPRPVTDLRPAVPAAVRDALARALAKTPADRFATTAEFAGALGPHEPVSAAPSRHDPTMAPSSPAKSHRARWVAGGAAIVISLLALAAWQRVGPFGRWLDGAGHSHLARRDWILVAEFDGPPDDTTLAVAARSLVSTVLDQSEILATVPRDQIRLALQQAGKPADTRVSGEVARELAYRRAVRAVLEGEIQRIGTGYSIVLRVVDAESLKVIAAERGKASNDDALIPALGDMAVRLRRDLGERREALAATRSASDVATPSFEAYRLFIRASRMVRSNEASSLRAAVPLLYEALALDPDFAAAWSVLGATYYNLKLPDSSRTAHEQALSRPDRLSRIGRLNEEAALADIDGDYERALEAYDRLLEYAPTSVVALHNRSIPLWRLGRREEALESTRRAQSASPFGPNPILVGNESEYLCSLGRTDEARAIARKLPGAHGRYRLAYCELAAGNWSSAESLAAAGMQDAGIADSRIPGFLASAQAGRGALREAAASYARAERIGARAVSPVYFQNKARIGWLLLSHATQGAIPPPADTWAGDSSTATILSRGLRAALAGDPEKARRMLAEVRTKPGRGLLWQGVTPLLLEAWIDGASGRWDQVIKATGPTVSFPLDPAHSNTAGIPAIRWALASAYEELGQPDSAATWMEWVASDLRDLDACIQYRGVLAPIAHQRLVMLYTRMGRLPDAERHLAILERWWDRPDDIARRMLDEARAAVRLARAMEGPERARS